MLRWWKALLFWAVKFTFRALWSTSYLHGPNRISIPAGLYPGKKQYLWTFFFYFEYINLQEDPLLLLAASTQGKCYWRHTGTLNACSMYFYIIWFLHKEQISCITYISKNSLKINKFIVYPQKIIRNGTESKTHHVSCHKDKQNLNDSKIMHWDIATEQMNLLQLPNNFRAADIKFFQGNDE